MSGWDESKHPRVPAGSSAGGQFGTGGTGGASNSGGGVPVGKIPSKSSAEYPPKDPSGADTQRRFSDGKGNYTPEREALHRAIIAKYLEGTSPVAYPTVTVLGGGPAAGKSTGFVMPENTVHIDVDKIREQLPEYQEQVGKNKTISAFTHEESSDIAKKIARVATADSRNVLLDGTGNSSLTKLAGKIASFRSRGYRVNAQYTVIEPDVAMERMLKRAERTGRYVPEDFLRDVHSSIAHVLPAAIRAKAFNTVEVWDNSGASRKLIYSGGRDHARETTHDPALWRAFLGRDKG